MKKGRRSWSGPFARNRHTTTIANVATAGVAAPVLSTLEDVTSFGLVLVALLIPVLVLVILLALIWSGWRLWRRIRHRKHAPYAAPTAAPTDWREPPKQPF